MSWWIGFLLITTLPRSVSKNQAWWRTRLYLATMRKLWFYQAIHKGAVHAKHANGKDSVPVKTMVSMSPSLGAMLTCVRLCATSLPLNQKTHQSGTGSDLHSWALLSPSLRWIENNWHTIPCWFPGLSNHQVVDVNVTVSGSRPTQENTLRFEVYFFQFVKPSINYVV